MDEIGRYGVLQLPYGSYLPAGGKITVMDFQAIYGLWIAMAFLIVISWLVTSRLKRHPGRLQYLFEVTVGAFDTLCRDSIGPNLGRRYVSFVGSTFLLLLICNWLGAIPGMIEPTKNINTTLGLALVGFTITLIETIRIKSLKTYVSDLFEPFILMGPMNIIGELAKIVSIACRLFGNIMGGAIIIEVVSHLTAFIITPIPLVAYFGLAVGLIQAFVFTMLTMTYLAVAIGESSEEGAA